MKTDFRINEFKNRIDFATTLAGAESVGAVCLDWPNPVQLPPLAGGGWQQLADILVLEEPGEASRKWVLQKGDTVASLQVFVSSVGTSRARERLVNLASETMAARIPYERPSEQLGELTVAIRNALAQDFIWVYRNVCAQVQIDGSEPDAATLAISLQKQMEAALIERPASRLPQVERVTLSHQNLTVGRTVRVELALAPGPDTDGLRVEFVEAPPAGKLSLKSEDGRSAEFEGVSPGQAVIRVGVLNPRTLLSATKELTVEVLPR